MTHGETLMSKQPRKTGLGITLRLCLIVDVGVRMTIHSMNNVAL